MARPLSFAAALPPAMLIGFTAVALVLAFAGRHPMWPISHPNLTEAAATRDAATVMLLIREGDDPNVARPVRAGILDRGAVRATPLEAALRERRLEIVDILLRHGAVLSETERIDFTCAARARGDEDFVRYFEARGGAVVCQSRQSAR
jgi:ankyrin repeat protein